MWLTGAATAERLASRLHVAMERGATLPDAVIAHAANLAVSARSLALYSLVHKIAGGSPFRLSETDRAALESHAQHRADAADAALSSARARLDSRSALLVSRTSRFSRRFLVFSPRIAQSHALIQRRFTSPNSCLRAFHAAMCSVV